MDDYDNDIPISAVKVLEEFRRIGERRVQGVDEKVEDANSEQSEMSGGNQQAPDPNIDGDAVLKEFRNIGRSSRLQRIRIRRRPS